jgi:hypothetical protein
MGQKINSRIINKLNIMHPDSEWTRRASATDNDIKNLKQRDLDIQNLIIETLIGIRSMAEESNLEINAQDNLGNTALNYCYTYKIYLELRRQGASFQLPAWAHFNPEFIIGGVALTTIVAEIILAAKMIQNCQRLDAIDYRQEQENLLRQLRQQERLYLNNIAPRQQYGYHVTQDIQTISPDDVRTEDELSSRPFPTNIHGIPFANVSYIPVTQATVISDNSVTNTNILNDNPESNPNL